MGNYNGTKETFGHLTPNPAIYNTYPNIDFVVQRVGLFDTLMFDGYTMPYDASNSDSNHITFSVDLHPHKGVEYAYIEYFPISDSIHYEYFRGELAESSGRSYFGKKQ